MFASVFVFFLIKVLFLGCVLWCVVQSAKAADATAAGGGRSGGARCYPVAVAGANGEREKERSRCLANVWYIGASKTGSTTLSTLLMHRTEHIRAVVRDKPCPLQGECVNDRRRAAPEAHLWDRGEQFGYETAQALAREAAATPLLNDSLAQRRKDGVRPLVLHYTPHYLYIPRTAARIRRVLGPIYQRDAERPRFVVTLRDPVERAISSYWFKNSRTQLGGKNAEDHGSISDMLRLFHAQIAERRRYDKCVAGKRRAGKAPLASAEACFRSMAPGVLYRQHIDKSIYVDQLRRWLSVFPPQDFLVVRTQDFTGSADAQRYVVDRVLDFYLQREPYSAEPLRSWSGPPHVLKLPEKLQTQDTDTRKTAAAKFGSTHNSKQVPTPQRLLHELRDFFRPYNQELNILLQTDIGFPT